MTDRFIVQEMAEQAAGLTIQATATVPKRLVALADQAVRAASSVALNIAEARGRAGKDRGYHFSVALGSAREAGSALALLGQAGVSLPKPAAEAAQLLDQVRAILWRILHPVTHDRVVRR